MHAVIICTAIFEANFILMRSVLLVFFCLALSANLPVFSQYYYNDVIAVSETNTLYATLKANKVTQVSAINVGYDNMPDEDFVYRKRLLNNGATIITESKIAQGTPTTSTALYTNNKVVKVTDSSDKVLTTTQYTYNAAGNINTIDIITDDDFMNSYLEEKHTWLYDAAGLPTQLTIIKNKTDTTLVTFVKDDAGNIGEERWQKKGRRIETYFYYYNAKKQMTDVVRNNLKAQRMLPDFLFEYDPAGHVVQAVQVLQGSSDYIIWQYLYDDTGLKQKDILRNKQKELLGTIQYTYR